MRIKIQRIQIGFPIKTYSMQTWICKWPLKWIFSEMRWILFLAFLIPTQKMVIYGKKHHSPKKQQNQHTHISRLLDKLLENYVNHSCRKLNENISKGD